jgi:hypothetical protein
MSRGRIFLLKGLAVWAVVAVGLVVASESLGILDAEESCRRTSLLGETSRCRPTACALVRDVWSGAESVPCAVFNLGMWTLVIPAFIVLRLITGVRGGDRGDRRERETAWRRRRREGSRRGKRVVWEYERD